jgi:integral membrane sensor domain MASE1
MINSPHIKLFWKTIAANLSVAAAVYLTAWASSQAFRGEAHSFSPIWPASGISLAAILLLGPRILPGIFLPLCASSLVAGSPWLFSFLAPAGVTLSIWGASTLLRRQRFDIALSSTRDVLLLAGLGAIVPMGVSAFSSASWLVVSGMMPASGLWAVASIYWATSTAGTVVVTPVILLIAKGRFLPKGISLKQFVLAVFQLAIVFSSAWFAFHSESSQGIIMDSLAYLPFPFLIWVALARGLPAAALSVLIVVMTAAVFTSAGRGPFVTESTLFTIWQIEIFIAIVTTTGLLIGAGSEAQRREKILLAEAATRKAELERLKAQIHPHLLFNCLTTIHSLIRTDTTAAQAGLFSLSALLRKSLDVAKEPMIPLRLELEIIRASLELDKMRFEEGLEWSVSADARTEDFPVPPMLLQPLIENAVKHGVVEGFGRVNLEAHIEGEDLLVLVSNTAPPDSNPENWGESVGLASVRSRIADACPTGSTVHFSRTPDGLIQALVRIKRAGRNP